MAALKAGTAKLGAPKVQVVEAVLGGDATALYFGTTKINNNFEVVDAVVKENGGTADTLRPRPATNTFAFPRTYRSRTAADARRGPSWTPRARRSSNINKGEPFYGEVTILEVPYITVYEPIKDASGKVIGIYYVGYKK